MKTKIISVFPSPKIALAQLRVIPGRPQLMLDQMRKMAQEAGAQGADLIAFPEMVFGYFHGDDWQSDAFCAELMRYNDVLQRESEQGLAIAFGNVFLDDKLNERIGLPCGYHPNEDGRTRKYNSVYIFQNGKPVSRLFEPLSKETRQPILPTGIQVKTLLPNYRFFHDKRYFYSLLSIAQDFNLPIETLLQPHLIEVNGQKVPIGFELCEDLWSSDYRHKLAELNPTEILLMNGAKAIVNLSASPWTAGKNQARDRRVYALQRHLRRYQSPLYYVNVVGTQNNGKNIVTFDGGTTIYNSEGAPEAKLEKSYQEGLLSPPFRGDLGGPNAHLYLGGPNSKEDLSEPKEQLIAQKYAAIHEGLTSFPKKKVVIGLSGGIDSAVVGALVVQAFGQENVLAFNFPTKNNSPETQSIAQKIANNLGIPLQNIPIQEEYLREIESLNTLGLGELSQLNKENIQAKIRGKKLSDIAGLVGGIYTCNANKLELATGYYTLDADGRGAIAPLGDLLKSEVFDMANYLNKLFEKEVIPAAIIPDENYEFGEDKVHPSAELQPLANQQKDPFKIGYHDAIIAKLTAYKVSAPEDFLEWYIAGTLAKNLGIPEHWLKLKGVDTPRAFIADLDFIVRSVHQNRFKRVQAPPLIVTSPTAFGFDRLESITPYNETQRYTELKQIILGGEI